MQRQTSSTTAASAAASAGGLRVAGIAKNGYNASFDHGSGFCAPVPTERYVRPKSEPRDKSSTSKSNSSSNIKSVFSTSNNSKSQQSLPMTPRAQAVPQTFSRYSMRRPRSRSSISPGGASTSSILTGLPPIPSPGPLGHPSTVSSAGQASGEGQDMLLLQHHNGPAVGYNNNSLSRSKASSGSSSSSSSSFSAAHTAPISSPVSSPPPPPVPPSPSTIYHPSAAASAAAASAKSAHSRLSHRIHLIRPGDGLFALDLRNASHSDLDSSRSPTVGQMSGSINRPESLSSTSAATFASAPTMYSDSSTAGDNGTSRLFVQRNGRTFLSGPNIAYPLPVDLTELHRQTLRTLLLIQLFGAPLTNQSAITNPPLRVLEVGCGSGFWSMMCHQYFKARGHSGISFTGIDIAPLAPDNNPGIGADSMKPDSDMKWKFIQHDISIMPWPLPAEDFDLIMVKDLSLVIKNPDCQAFSDEQLRLLRPGGCLEVWDSDHPIRMLRPHVPAAVSSENADDQLAASSLGAYVINGSTPFSAPLNPYLIEYNQWLGRALESRTLSACPCAQIGPSLLQESESLTDVRSRRMAIPLSDVRWEREGVGGVFTKDGKSDFEAIGREQGPKVEKKTLSAGQIALRQTAMLTVVQQVQALEHILREVSGKSQDEWDVWLGKMMGDLMNDGGTSWGECLEIGAWSAKKKAKRT